MSTALQPAFNTKQVPGIKNLLFYNQEQKQIKVLKSLLKAAQHTQFGVRYDYSDLIRMADPRVEFKKWITANDYETMNSHWWHLSRKDIPDITWPGIIPFYGISSGSTQSASKYIPVSHQSIMHWNRISQKILTTLVTKYGISPSLFSKNALMIGGSSSLRREGLHEWGDNSGIMAKNRPSWLKGLYKPEKEVQDLTDWESRKERIIKSARGWDIAFIVGNIAWVQHLIEAIVEHYKVSSIHDIWPNMSMILHSGVFLDPYQHSLERNFRRQVMYMDIYSATEGIFAFQNQPKDNSMKLILNQNVYFEFTPFSSANYTDDGKLKNQFPDIIPIEEIEENKPYSVLVSTSSGAWHYQMGDVIQFVDKAKSKIKLIGRTKDQISISGEHLTLDNINQCIKFINSAFDLSIREYCVAGVKDNSTLSHHWYLGIDERVDVNRVKQSIDDYLMVSNDDYKIQRKSLIKDIKIHILPERIFYEWLQYRGKLNGQAKTPKILKGDLFEKWLAFLNYNETICI